MKREYTYPQLLKLMADMRELYDVVRLVDPHACRELRLADNGEISTHCNCYDVWKAHGRCSNCTSFKALETGLTHRKAELVDDRRYDISSIPLSVTLPGGTPFACVLELISYTTVNQASPARQKDVDNDPYLLTHDTLTGQLNADGMTRAIGQALRDDPDVPLVVGVCDICNFSLFNSLFGAERGNEALTNLADVLDEMCGPAGMVGRLRDDRFAFCMPASAYSDEALMAALDKLSQHRASPTYKLTTHAGVYAIEKADAPVTYMLDCASVPLRSLRPTFDNAVGHFTSDMMEESIRRQEVLGSFESGIQDGRFHIFLQPQVDASGTVRGAEALVREVQEDGTTLPPAAFIDILEQSSLIAELDAYVWDLAAQQLQAWEHNGWTDLYISVNVSPRDFYYIDVPETFVDLCDRYGISRANLHVEITETAFLGGDAARADVARLSGEGFCVEVDDFGTGYSSLSMLKDMPANVIKIDMAFLRETEHKARSRVILSSIMQMAKDLGMSVVTEGVEREDQMDSLSRMGCDMFQGFLFSKPIPVADFERKYLGREPARTRKVGPAAPELA